MKLLDKLVTWSFVHAPAVAKLWTRKHSRRDEPPFVPLSKPLAEIRLGLVTTGGVHHPGQKPFLRKKQSPIGDGSHRVLDLNNRDFRITHDWYDHRDAEKDINLILPVDRLVELVDKGIIGDLHPEAIALMGHVEETEERRLELETAPAIAEFFASAEVDAVLLVPA